MAIYLGLKLAWRRDYTKFILESDCSVPGDLILGMGVGGGRNRVLITRCKELLSRSMTIIVRHILREASRAVDWVAKWR